jgi:hypothetical protein
MYPSKLASTDKQYQFWYQLLPVIFCSLILEKGVYYNPKYAMGMPPQRIINFYIIADPYNTVYSALLLVKNSIELTLLGE